MTTVTVNVMRHADGRKVGTLDIDAAEWTQYAAGEHPAYQWPEGLAEAGNVLSDDERDVFGLSAKSVIYLED